VIVPLNATHELLVVVCAGLRFAAVDQSVDAVGLHFTVHVADDEFVRIQPAIVYVSPLRQSVTFCRTPPPPVALVFAICWYCVPPPVGGLAVWIVHTVVGFVAR